MYKKEIDRQCPGEIMPGTGAAALPATRGMAGMLITVFLIAAMAAATGLAIYIIAVPGQSEPFTEFYILGQGGKADNYPASFDPGEQKPVLAGIVNHENAYKTYDLVVALNDSKALTILHKEKIGLADGKTWEKTIQLKPDRSGNMMRIEFLLYRDGNVSVPYRDLYLRVNVYG